MILLDFIFWYFFKAPIKILAIWRNFLRFSFDFFGVRYHLRTFFRPWRLATVNVDNESIIQAFLMRILARIVGSVIGAIARTVAIFSGLASFIAFLALGIAVEFLWLFWFLLSLAYLLLWVIGFFLEYDVYPQLDIYFFTQGVIIFSFAFILFLRDRLAKSYARRHALEEAFIVKKIGFDWHSKKLLEDNNLDLKDIKYLRGWYKAHRIEKGMRRSFWSREFLNRVIPIGMDWASGYTPMLDRFSRNTKTVSFAFDEHLLFSQYWKEIDMVEQILSQSGKNNVLLAGEEGVGKHLMLMELERLIETGRSLPALSFKRFLWLDIEMVFSGVNQPGDLRIRLEAIFNEALYAGNIVLAIEDLNRFFDPAFPEAADVLVPFLQSRRSQVVATITPRFLSNVKRRDVINQLTMVKVNERSFRDTIFTLLEAADSIEAKEKIFIPYKPLKKLIELVDKFFIEASHPQKDIDFLQEIVSFLKSKNKKVLEEAHILEVISQRTGIPLGKLSESEKVKLLHIEEALREELIGQPEAVKVISESLKRARMGVRSHGRPIGSFLFLGSTGVGKTTAAKTLAKFYFGKEFMIRFDMSEYQNAQDKDRIIDDLSRQVKQNPFSLLLLDEIEKAHKNILNLFLQILDEGILTDTGGFKVDFRNLIIIGTSNAGSVFIQDNIGRAGTEEFNRDLLEYLKRGDIFKPELINRFDAIVTFKLLEERELKEIAGLLLKDFAQRLKKEHNIDFIINDDLKIFLAKKGFSPQYGARPMRRVLQDTIETLIANKLLKEELKKGDKIELKSWELE